MGNSKIHEAYVKCKPARELLRELDAVLMESTEDKSGIVWQRWYLQVSKPLEVKQRVVNIIVFATPTWWDVFTPIVASPYIEDVLKALKALRPGFIEEPK